MATSDLLHNYREALVLVDSAVNIGAKSIGATPNVFKLFLSLLVAYPLAIIYRLLRPNALNSSFRRNLYFAATGTLLCMFNFGHDALHSFLSILATYTLARCFGGSGWSVIVGFAFHVSYLTIGYYRVSSEKYDVSWTTAQCVLCLRHIGLLFDLWDGRRSKGNPATSASSSFPAPLARPPSFVELVAHTYFFGGFLVGPQFPMTRYLDFINDFPSNKADEPDPDVTNSSGPRVNDKVVPRSDSPTGVSALKRLSSGLLSVAAFQIGAALVPQSHLLSSYFFESSFLYKMGYILLWGKLVLYKYVGCWLIAEGSCILSGLTYNGLDENGNILWNSCANIEIRGYEKASTFRGVIECFNINTNKWVQNYVFKRLKFLGSKELSAVSSLFFLALWHGVYSGYFMCFALEFVVMKFENDLQSLKKKSPLLSRVWDAQPSFVRFLIGKWFMLQFLGYALVSFCLLSSARWMAVYASVYYVGHLIFFSWLLVAPVVNIVFSRKKESVKSQ